MVNRIITKPAVEDAATLYSNFGCGNNDIIALSVEDFSDTLKDAANAVVIENGASGPDRMKSALRGIEADFTALAPDHNLYRADKVLCLIVATEDFKINEMNHLTEFFKNFNDDTNIIWGVIRNGGDTYGIKVRLLVVYK